MKDVLKKMEFEVFTDLKPQNNTYNVVIDLENEVDSHTRELAIALSGAIVRNNFKKLYGKILDNNELAEVIKDKVNTWIPKECNFYANNVNVSMKLVAKR